MNRLLTQWFAGPRQLTIEDAEWWQRASQPQRLTAVVTIALAACGILAAAFTGLYMASDSCLMNQNSWTCWFTNGNLAETVRIWYSGK